MTRFIDEADAARSTLVTRIDAWFSRWTHTPRSNVSATPAGARAGPLPTNSPRRSGINAGQRHHLQVGRTGKLTPVAELNAGFIGDNSEPEPRCTTPTSSSGSASSSATGAASSAAAT